MLTAITVDTGQTEISLDGTGSYAASTKKMFYAILFHITTFGSFVINANLTFERYEHFQEI
jgi:hypothetical protein